MPRNFSRHEQILRIFALLEILAQARQPLDDQRLVAQLKERLGLSRLSVRTLHRDCEFLVSCGYAIDHAPLAGNRRHGWKLQEGAAGRRIPPPPITLLELAAFAVGRELLRPLEGTILWTGIESLRQRIEDALPSGTRDRLATAKAALVVMAPEPPRYADRPRLLSTLTAAITDCREIEITVGTGNPAAADRRRVQPVHLVIQPPRVLLLGQPAADAATGPVLLDIERIEQVRPLDITFTPRSLSREEIAALLAARS